MEVMYPRCAGLDVHKETVVACVRIVEGGDVSRSVRTFATTTASLIELGEWLEVNGCTHVAMEATGVYWKPVWQVLVDSSLELVLANAAQVKNVPGRKSDVNDATWVSELLAHGLVRASFVPEPAIQQLRGLLRTRKQLVREKASHVQRLQKTLEEANIKIESVLSDVMGRSGRAMIQALIDGESDPAKLAALAHWKVRASAATLREALHGRVKRHHRFLRLHLQQVDALDAAIAEIDREADAGLACFRDAVKQLREVA
jgi:transposase